MSSGPENKGNEGPSVPAFTRTFGLRLALWYATLFVSGAIAIGFVTLLIVIVALTGGWLATQSALFPIRRLALAVQHIIRTGRTDARVPLDGSGDAIDELTSLFNTMLDKIEGLVTAMRGALDN